MYKTNSQMAQNQTKVAQNAKFHKHGHNYFIHIFKNSIFCEELGMG